MTGIGIIIILFQIYPFMGHKSAKSTIDICLKIGEPFMVLNWMAVSLGLLTIAIIYLFPKLAKVVPSTLVALLTSIIAVFIIDYLAIALEHPIKVDKAAILFFLMCAMTIVEVVDAHEGFSIIRTLSRVRLLWIIGVLTFFFSSALDNLTTSIVMTALLRKLMKKHLILYPF